MKTDGYTPRMQFEELLKQSRLYGPPALNPKALPGDYLQGKPADLDRPECPCLQGAPCVLEALADEFEQLAGMFRQRRIEIRSTSCPDCEERWADEGGRVLSDIEPASGDEL